jgi:hypothetical protein
VGGFWVEHLALLERLDAGSGSDQAAYSVWHLAPLASHALAVADTEPQTELFAGGEWEWYQLLQNWIDLVLRPEERAVMSMVTLLQASEDLASLQQAAVEDHA